MCERSGDSANIAKQCLWSHQVKQSAVSDVTIQAFVVGYQSM